MFDVWGVCGEVAHTLSLTHTYPHMLSRLFSLFTRAHTQETHIHTHTHTHTHACVRTHTHMHTHTRACACTHTHTHAHTRTQTHTHTHIQKMRLRLILLLSLLTPSSLLPASQGAANWWPPSTPGGALTRADGTQRLFYLGDEILKTRHCLPTCHKRQDQGPLKLRAASAWGGAASADLGVFSQRDSTGRYTKCAASNCEGSGQNKLMRLRGAGSAVSVTVFSPSSPPSVSRQTLPCPSLAAAMGLMRLRGAGRAYKERKDAGVQDRREMIKAAAKVVWHISVCSLSVSLVTGVKCSSLSPKSASLSQLPFLHATHAHTGRCGKIARILSKKQSVARCEGQGYVDCYTLGSFQ